MMRNSLPITRLIGLALFSLVLTMLVLARLCSQEATTGGTTDISHISLIHLI